MHLRNADALKASLTLAQWLALQQLSSATLPIGGFTYSQGLEAAVELKLIDDECSTRTWIHHQLDGSVSRAEAPLWSVMYDALDRRDWDAVAHWNQWFYASRETRELRQETEQMGWSLLRLATELNYGNTDDRQRLGTIKPLTLPLVHAFLCQSWQLPQALSLSAYLFSWLENQVAAAVRSVPLGQLSGQRVLTAIARDIPPMVADALARALDQPPRLDTFAPQFAIVASRHETQFSRLFRS